MTLKELIKSNPEGFTFDLATGKMAEHSTGYYVALTDHRIKDLSNFDDIAPPKAFNLFSNISKVKVYLGGWKDGSEYCLDYTMHVENKENAQILAVLFKQKAVYDIKEQKSIYPNIS